MYEIIISRQAQHGFKRIPKIHSEAVMSKVDELALNPRPREAIKLKTKTALWRIRQGDYRIVYDIDDEKQIINIWDIDHRSQVYKWL